MWIMVWRYYKGEERAKYDFPNTMPEALRICAEHLEEPTCVEVGIWKGEEIVLEYKKE